MREITVAVFAPNDAESVCEVLIDALRDNTRRRSIIENPANTSYGAFNGHQLIAGAVVRWDNESEIELFAVAPGLRRKGFGQALMKQIIAEGRRRNIRRLLVGTASLDAAAVTFYQKCGFRMSFVRRDYWNPPEHWDDDVQLRDMIVFDYIFAENTP